MSTRILVTYGTWHGSTTGVAEKIGDVLKERGADVDVKPAREVSDVASYDAVVVGGGIRAGSMHGDARNLMKKHAATLAGKKTAFFIVCLTAAKDDEKSRAEVDGYVAKATAATPEIEFVETGRFAGAYDRSKSGLIIRFLMWALKQGSEDSRNWDAVSEWAGKVATAFGLESK